METSQENETYYNEKKFDISLPFISTIYRKGELSFEDNIIAFNERKEEISIFKENSLVRKIRFNNIIGMEVLEKFKSKLDGDASRERISENSDRNIESLSGNAIGENLDILYNLKIRINLNEVNHSYFEITLIESDLGEDLSLPLCMDSYNLAKKFASKLELMINDIVDYNNRYI